MKYKIVVMKDKKVVQEKEITEEELYFFELEGEYTHMCVINHLPELEGKSYSLEKVGNEVRIEVI